MFPVKTEGKIFPEKTYYSERYALPSNKKKATSLRSVLSLNDNSWLILQGGYVLQGVVSLCIHVKDLGFKANN